MYNLCCRYLPLIFSILTTHVVFDFWEHYGVQSIRQYILSTARAAGKLVNTGTTWITFGFPS